MLVQREIVTITKEDLGPESEAQKGDRFVITEVFTRNGEVLLQGILKGELSCEIPASWTDVNYVPSHIAIFGTYNKLIGIVRNGLDSDSRIVAMVREKLNDPKAIFDWGLKRVVYDDNGYRRKLPITIEHIFEY